MFKRRPKPDYKHIRELEVETGMAGVEVTVAGVEVTVVEPANYYEVRAMPPGSSWAVDYHNVGRGWATEAAIMLRHEAINRG